jgi:hypothetical protein
MSKETMAAIHEGVSRELASSTDELTAPVMKELTDAEISMVAGGLHAELQY